MENVMEMKSLIKEIIIEEVCLSAEAVNSGATIRSIGIDSLMLAEVISAIEVKLDRELDTNKLFNSQTGDSTLDELIDSIVQGFEEQ